MDEANKPPEPTVRGSETRTVRISAGGGRYQIRRRLGRGGMGEVFEAFDTRLGRSVALKRVAPEYKSDAGYRRRLQKEAERASKLNDSNIAAIYDFFEEDSEVCIVMEYVEGKTLREFLRKKPDLEEFLPIARQCVHALQVAHEQNIIHSDLKPDNIMLTEKGLVKVLDFGVAKVLPDSLVRLEAGEIPRTASGARGTPQYMAPEVYRDGEITPQADIYSLGVVYYEALSGKNPFGARQLPDVWDRVLNYTPPPLTQSGTDVPRELDTLVQRMISKERRHRYLDAAEIIRDLEQVIRDATEDQKQKEQQKRFIRKVITAVAAAIIVVTALAVTPETRNFVGDLLGLNRKLPEKKQLVVMPFDASPDFAPAQALASGLYEDLLQKLITVGYSDNTLETVPQRIMERSEVRTLKEAGPKLGVNLAMMGTILTDGKDQVLELKLYETSSGDVVRSLKIDLSEGGSSGEVALQAINMIEVDLSEEAEAYVQGTTPPMPRTAELFLKGKGYLRDYDNPENVDHAIQVFESALGIDPEFAAAKAGLGQAYWQKFKDTRDREWIVKARSSCDEALAIEPKLALGHVALGSIHTGLGEFEAAASEFMTAIELEPSNDEAFRGLASAHQEMDRPAEAEGAFRRAIELHPDYWGGYNWLGSFYARQGRFSEAAEMFRQVVALSPDNPIGYSNLGGAYQLLERYEDAIEMYRSSIELRPTSRAFNNLGALNHEQGNYAAAAAAYRDALRLDDRDHIIWGNLGVCYKLAGQREQALEAYREAATRAQDQLELNPRNPFLRARLAEYLGEQGQKEEAMRHLSVALDEGAQEPEVLVTVAGVYELLGERDLAIGPLNDGIRLGYPADQIRDTPGFKDLFADPRVD